MNHITLDIQMIHVSEKEIFPLSRNICPKKNLFELIWYGFAKSDTEQELDKFILGHQQNFLMPHEPYLIE